MALTRRLAPAGAVLVLALLAAPAAAGVDGALVGIWQARKKGPGGTTVITWQIAPSGAYATRLEGPVPLPGEVGLLTASGGSWTIHAATLRSDQGTYALDGQGTLTTVSPLGSLTWRRVAETPGFAQIPSLKGKDLAHVKAEDLLALGRAVSRYWFADARLVGLFGAVQPDGTFRVATNPPPVNLVFYAPSAKQCLLVVPANRGDFLWFPGAGPFGSLTMPVPRGLRPLPEILASAKAEGFPVGPATQVSLRSWPNVAGDPTHCTWMFGGVVMMKDAFLIDAVTGKRIRYADASGWAALQARMAAWEKGESRPLGTDFAAWRRAADAWAATWSPKLKLYGVSVRGDYRGSLQPGFASFKYFLPAPQLSRIVYQVFEVVVRPTGVRGVRGRDLPGHAVPHVAPAGLVGAAAAAKSLWALNPQIPTRATCLQLGWFDDKGNTVGGWPGELRLSGQQFGGVLHDDGTPPHGAWAWRMVARRPGGETGFGMAGRGDSHIGMVYCDAKTGKALDAPAPDLSFKQTKFR
jgi:hypothetical protein